MTGTITFMIIPSVEFKPKISSDEVVIYCFICVVMFFVYCSIIYAQLVEKEIVILHFSFIDLLFFVYFT
jgi:hypothetical protein